MSNRDHHGSNYLGGLIAGALIGAGLFYFFNSTKEGKEAKKKIKQRSKEVLDDLTCLIGEFEEKGEEFRTQAKRLQVELEEKAKDIKEEVVEEAKEKLGHIEQLRERGRGVSKKFFVRNGKSLS
jgi:gas vesicle protein